ncbi:MAG: hypothetical protein WKF71_08405 [Pyrinomonadaceae bacterium]
MATTEKFQSEVEGKSVDEIMQTIEKKLLLNEMIYTGNPPKRLLLKGVLKMQKSYTEK